MTTLTLKNVPEELYTALKNQAALHRRSINNEAIVNLEQNLLAKKKRNVEDILHNARLSRKKAPNIYITDKELTKIINEGRS